MDPSSSAQGDEEPAKRIERAEDALHCGGGCLRPCEQVEQREAHDEDQENGLDPLVHRSPPSGVLGAIYIYYNKNAPIASLTRFHWLLFLAAAGTRFAGGSFGEEFFCVCFGKRFRVGIFGDFGILFAIGDVGAKAAI